MSDDHLLWLMLGFGGSCAFHWLLLFLTACRRSKPDATMVDLLRHGNSLRTRQVSILSSVASNLRAHCDRAAEIVELNRQILKLTQERRNP